MDKNKPFNQHVPTSLQHHPPAQDLHPLLREQEYSVKETETIHPNILFIAHCIVAVCFITFQHH